MFNITYKIYINYYIIKLINLIKLNIKLIKIEFNNNNIILNDYSF